MPTKITKAPYQAPLLHLSTLPYPRYTGKPSKIIEYTLPVPLIAEQWTIPAGTIVKLQTTSAFGWVITPNLGNKFPRRIFKY